MHDVVVQQIAHRVVLQDISAQVYHSDVRGHSGYHASIAREHVEKARKGQLNSRKIRKNGQ